MHKMIGLLALACAVLSACGEFPRDVEGTLDRIRSSKVIRVGIIQGGPAHDAPITEIFLDHMQASTGATPALTSGSMETLFTQLETGALDLVVGEIAEDSPWVSDVAVIEPLAQRRRGKKMMWLSPILRNGENRFRLVVEREVRNLQVDP